MLGINFVDRSIRILSGTTWEECSDIYLILRSIYDWYKDNNNYGYTDKIDNKIEFCYFLIQERTAKQIFYPDMFIEKMMGGKYEQFVHLIRENTDDVSEEEIKEFRKLAYNKLKICSLMDGKKQIHDTLDKLDAGAYEDEEEFISLSENLIVSLYGNYMNMKSREFVEQSASLDLLNDSHDRIFKSLKSSLSQKNIIHPGYEFLQNALPSNGFEERRIYIIGGTSGVGKSAMLVNFMYNSILNCDQEEINHNTRNYYLYITSENLIDESYLRYYCIFSGKPKKSIEKDILNYSNLNHIEKEIKDFLYRKNYSIDFRYLSGYASTLEDVEALISGVDSDPEKRLKAVFLDYMDLIGVSNLSGQRSENVRLIHSFLAVGLKNLSIQYNVPIITATQLNKAGYQSDYADETQMGESMGKVHHADFLMFLQKNRDREKNTDLIVQSPDAETGELLNYKSIRATILKNRNGPTGKKYEIVMRESDSNYSNIFNYSMEQGPDEQYTPDNAYTTENEANPVNQGYVNRYEGSTVADNVVNNTSPSNLNHGDDLLPF